MNWNSLWHSRGDKIFVINSLQSVIIYGKVSFTASSGLQEALSNQFIRRNYTASWRISHQFFILFLNML